MKNIFSKILFPKLFERVKIDIDENGIRHFTHKGAFIDPTGAPISSPKTKIIYGSNLLSRLLSKLFNYGSIYIKDSNIDDQFGPLFGIRQLEKFIKGKDTQTGKLDKLNPVTESNQIGSAHISKELLKTVNPSNKVVFIPPIPDLFDRSLWIATQCKVGSCPYWYFKKGDWINKGDIICTFPIYVGNFLLPKGFNLNILAPCNGILIYHGDITSFTHGINDLYSYSKLESKDFYSRDGIVLLVDEDELVPSTTKSCLMDFYKIVVDKKNDLFFKPKEFQGNSSYSVENVDTAINLLVSAPIIRYHVKDYKQWIEEVRRTTQIEEIRAVLNKITF